jgi:hypothetical protein
MPLAGLAMMAILSGCGDTAAPTAPTSSLDSTPPPAPVVLDYSRDAMGQAVLTWSQSSAPDVASYEVYMYSPSPDRDNSYIVVDNTVASDTQYSLPWAASLSPSVFRVRAVDTSGNKSAFSTDITVWSGPGSPPPSERVDLPAKAKKI